MMIASYRNTERGIRTARQKSVVLPFIAPVKPQLIVPDNSLVSPTMCKFERFLDQVNAAMAALRRLEKRKRKRSYFDVIVQRLCCVFNVTINDLRSERRDKSTVLARQAIYYWTWRLTAFSSVQIGKRLGGRDHSTVLSGISAYQLKRAQMGRHLRELRRVGK